VSQIEAEKLFKIAQENYEKKDYLKTQNCLYKILELYPENLSALINLSLCYFDNKNFEQAELILKKIIKIKINAPNIILQLVIVLEKQDKVDEAIHYINLGIKEKILDERLFIREKIILPAIFKDKDDIKFFRNRLNQNLNEILNSKKKISLDIDNQMLKPPHFELSYDEYDNLEINKKCVKFFRKIYPQINETNVLKNISKSKIKIGFISEHLTDHTIGKLYKGIILNLDKNKFDTIVFHTQKTKKGEIYESFINAEKNNIIKNYILPKKFKDKQKIISEQGLDILFYPEIGMSFDLYYLSFIRLAKYQITSWGHPETTGNNTVDYFLTSKLIEAQGSEKNFSENLLYSNYVPMYYYTPIVKNELKKDELSKNNIYSCPQTLYKIHPDFDDVLGNILKEDKNAILYFIKDLDNTFYKKLINRFKKNKNLDLNRIKFIKQLSWEGYINHCGQASVLLDPLYFSAGNSFYESMFYGTPTVTKPTKYTKSRLVLGAYNQMEIQDAPIAPVVNKINDYVETAVAIANNKNLYDLKKYYNKKAQEKLYENKFIIDDLEKIFIKLVN
jgi:predicted O-linked N-acetylglucosamine transferase (SPINDLY family)